MTDQLMFDFDSSRTNVNSGVDSIFNFFTSKNEYKLKIERCFDKTVSSVLDIFDKESVDDLDSPQKTILGTVFEKHVREEFQLEKGNLDFKINSVDVDLKFSVAQSWMIPPECVDNICIISSLTYPRRYAFGVLEVKEKYLNKGSNRDKKRTISKKNFDKIKWIL